MPEAPPDRPGHVGHTPQYIDAALREARLEGIFSSVVPRVLPGRHVYASQEFQQPQRFRRRSLFTVLASIDVLARNKRRIGHLQPWPEEQRAGVRLTTDQGV